MNFKEIHIGKLIQNRAKEVNVELKSELNLTSEELNQILKSDSIDTELLLSISKLLEYDFFRLYSQHLILYSPFKISKQNASRKKSPLPQFRKNIYSIEIIQFIVQQIKTNKKSIQEVIDEYNIPRTTIYKWLKKYTD